MTSTATYAASDEFDMAGRIPQKPVYGANTIEISCDLDEEDRLMQD
jgi:hypothetical protein